jgi:hypothetical protein
MKLKLKMEIGAKHLYVTDALPVVVMHPLVNSSIIYYHVIIFFPAVLTIILDSAWQEQKEILLTVLLEQKNRKGK